MRKINIIHVGYNDDGVILTLKKTNDTFPFDVRLDTDVIEFICDECHIALNDLLNIINTMKVKCNYVTSNDVNELDGWLYNDIDE